MMRGLRRSDDAPERDRAPSARGSIDRRGQTAIDYAIGITVFLLVIAFVFSFVPSIMSPFTGEPIDRPLIADRSADHLSQELLAVEPGSVELNATCTAEFFDADGTVADCRYDTDASDLPAALDVERPGVSMNVTITDGDENVRSIDGTDLTAGGTPHPSSSVVIARRLVLLEGDRGHLRVRVW